MAGQTLETIIAINARVGNGFSQVGQTLTELGSMVNGISQELINFGKESTEVYRKYELSMADAEVALSTTYGRSSKELKGVMDTLDAAATEWAATTIFHTDDVANAISEAAHAGWDLDQIMSGLPAAMQLAQAGGLDLSEAVNYIVKSTSAAGVKFKDMSNFIDLWTFAANSSASTVGEFGDAMLRMGSTMRFTGNTEELMTLMAVTANAGVVGSEAGTLIRNSMMRLVAPTDKAKKAMAELGASTTEMGVIMSDTSLVTANATLAAQGFSAFNEDGSLKNILDIYRELYVALGDVAGGYDKIATNEDALSILSSIFPTRTITEALTLLRGAAENYGGLYDKMVNGEATGYGKYAATTMMDTLNGKIETFYSKLERLKQVVGENLSDQVGGVLEGMGGFVDKISTMDEGTFSTIISGLEVLAVAGPGLITAGAAFRFIGTALSWTGGLPVAAIAMAAMVAAIHEMNEIDYEKKFGEMSLDQSQVAAYIDGLHEKFENANAEVKKFDDALQESTRKYNKTSAELSSELITKMSTGAVIKKGTQDYTNLMDLGKQMDEAVQAGIEAHYKEVIASLNTTFTGDTTNNPVWSQIMTVIEQGHAEEVAKAEKLSQELRDAMTSAFKDGSLTKDELDNMQSLFDQYDELMAKQQERANYLERQRILRKARTLGIDAITGTSAEVTAERDAELEQLYAQQDEAYFELEYWYDQAIKNGWEVQDYIPDTNGNYGTHKAGLLDKQYALNELKRNQQNQIYQTAASFSDFLIGLYSEGIEGSDLAGTWANLQTFAQAFREAGGTVTQGALNQWTANNNPQDIVQVHRYLESMVDALGGYETLQGYVDYFTKSGRTDLAESYQQLIDMYNVLGGFEHVSPEVGSQGLGEGNYDTDAATVLMSLINGAYGKGGITIDNLVEWIQEAQGNGMDVDWQSKFGDDLWSQINSQAQKSGMSMTDWISSAITAYMQQQEDEIAERTKDTTDESGKREIEKRISDEYDLQDLMLELDGDTTKLDATIEDEDGKEIGVLVDGDTTKLEQTILAIQSRYQNTPIWVRIQTKGTEYAEGGRATEPSIFGEAGAEWAIPEKHNERTADLLNAARQASGFTWGELIERFGGLNGTTQGNSTTIVYSPTINAGNADGVERVLQEDKKRFERWYEDRKLRDSLEVYA